MVASQVASTPVETGPGYDIDEIVTTSIALGLGSTEGPWREAGSWRPSIRLSWEDTIRRQESLTADGRADLVALACQSSLISEPQSWNIDL